MRHEPPYGAVIVRHLTKVGRHVPYAYEDLQQVKAMTQAELADWIGIESREFSQVILDNPPEVAAEMVHKRRNVVAETSSGAVITECAVSFLELLAHLFAGIH